MLPHGLARSLLALVPGSYKYTVIRSLAATELGVPTPWQVSSHGRVKSSTGVVSLGSPLLSGYRRVCIAGKFYAVHRLVAAAFLPLAEPRQWQVNHLDGDPSNNHSSNLQYATPSENLRHSWRTNLKRKSTWKPVLWRLVGQASWSASASQTEAASKLGVHVSAISRCCRGFSRQVVGPLGPCELVFAADEHKPKNKPQPKFQPGEIWQDGRHPRTGAILPDIMVSSHGRIWRLRLNYMTYGTPRTDGYCVIRHRTESLSVHRVVAATFLRLDKQPLLDVNHLDCNRANNRLDNLALATRSENMKHSYLQGGWQERRAINCKPVQARKSGCQGPWLHFNSVAAAASHVKLYRDTVSNICHGHRQQSKGWCFRLAALQPLPGEEWRPVGSTVLERARVNAKTFSCAE